jgi:hypothetical protein
MALKASLVKRPLPQKVSLYLLAVIFVSSPPPVTLADEPTSEQIEFFEKSVRPLLVEKCYQCHSAGATSLFAGLRLDSREGVLKGGDSGPAVIPGKPGESRLIQRIQGKPILMPPTGPLQDRDIATLVKWVEIGAPWAEQQSTATGDQRGAGAFDLEERKRNHWAWRPVRWTEPPAVRQSEWPRQPVDNYILAVLEKNGLQPAPPADRNTLIRRLSFDLRGLPPSPEEINTFASDSSPDAYEKLVDRFLGSSPFGEHWARHWMDLIRYSESHGSEGDPSVPQAWRYRDYLIRALNSDVPYDQLIREHLAGDLLPEPRINQEEGLNESMIATAHFRMVEHAYQPVDAWEDRVKFIDNQIDVISKTFQGLTVSCARCHDHKFDAISQKDFYALFGTLYGARPTQRPIDAPQVLNTGRDKLAELKSGIRQSLAETWLREARDLGALLRGTNTGTQTGNLGAYAPSASISSSARPAESSQGSLDPPRALRDAFEQAHCEDASPFRAWVELRDKRGDDFLAAWKKLTDYWQAEIHKRKTFNEENFKTLWDLSGDDFDKWVGHGTGFSPKFSKPGEFSVLYEGDRVLEGVYPGGTYTHLLSTKHNGVMQSPRFTIDNDYISLRLVGGDLSFAQLIIENHAVPGGGIYNMRSSPKYDQMGWIGWSTAYWKGFTAYVEFATRDDVTRFDYAIGDRGIKRRDDGRSYIGASRVVAHGGNLKPKETVVPILYLLGGEAPNSTEDLADLISSRLSDVVAAWRDGTLSEEQAVFLDYFVRQDLLPRSLERLESVRPLVAEYRAVEKDVPVARRAPGVLEESSPDQPLLIRGNHKNPGEIVPRHFLTALEGSTYSDARTVRLRLAQEVASPNNPLTARVMVNRIWRYLFGYGIVRTVDNFGKLGEAPSHAELLDYLADHFLKNGWSIKKIVRLLATSQAYRMSSQASPEAQKIDPSNKLLQHANVRRLDAEAIRDSLLAVSGRLDPTMYGRSINVYHAFGKDEIEGGSRKGPLDGAGRRSIYQEVRRDKQNPFFEVFDMPKPMTTRGQRDATNVPAQSLALLNSPFVIGQAQEWGKRLADGEAHSIDTRVEYMFIKALGRKPSAGERDHAATYLSSLAKEHRIPESGILRETQIWQDFAHAIFNLKEFIYVP